VQYDYLKPDGGNQLAEEQINSLMVFWGGARRP